MRLHSEVCLIFVYFYSICTCCRVVLGLVSSVLRGSLRSERSTGNVDVAKDADHKKPRHSIEKTLNANTHLSSSERNTSSSLWSSCPSPRVSLEASPLFLHPRRDDRWRTQTNRCHFYRPQQRPNVSKYLMWPHVECLWYPAWFHNCIRSCACLWVFVFLCVSSYCSHSSVGWRQWGFCFIALTPEPLLILFCLPFS